MDDKEFEIIKARLTAVERILRVQDIQATGDAVDKWWEVSQNENATPEEIDAAGKEAAKEVLATKNRERHETHLAGSAKRH
ncbi:MAG: hypothetical protein OQJ99_05100 [Rhodospirillales bacterium]|nr:hypothetical protein [Rhodospirillales bacterium]MCW8861813.1 hypothetical protein [Rhodospirillales bacterium]MCW8970785.1 hypothetical protein [Rhodospirillales bacterium]MCW9040529.1 hypothetical protein [Rhodospirillales bacterium]